MSYIKNVIRKIKMVHLQVAGVFALILLAAFLLWFNSSNSIQAMPAFVADVYFEGWYSIDGGPWQEIVEGKHIPATQGVVTLRGNFHEVAPGGEYVGIYRGELPVAFYTNHINLTFVEAGSEPYVDDFENPMYGESVCGKAWTAYTFTSDSNELIDIIIHNSHSFGNETAIDEMLSELSLWAGIDFEKGALASGESQRDVGMLMMLVSVVFLGIALFSTLIHLKIGKIIWLLGLVVLFAGVYFTYSADGVFFWSESIISNTTILGVSMMLYMLFIMMIVASFLGSMRRIGGGSVLVMALTDACFFLLPVLTSACFYDMWMWWSILQIVASAVLAVCLVKDFSSVRASMKWLYVGALLPLCAFAVDVIATWQGIWRGGVASRYVFIALFAVAVIMVLNLIPQNINAATKAKELEMEKIVLNAELAESRISTMMSQIRPHFIYNTLGSIEQLCEIDPPKAGELVHDFAKYLRGNFGELDNPKPILMSKEMDHVRHYVSIENVRFPDMTFTFEMNSDDFRIPALTIQPIVENAIKHGLMKLEKGGTIRVVSYETATHYCVRVVDNGAGFDTGRLFEDRQHVGLRNIRERLKAMVDGTIEIKSTVGVGTDVLIEIPKEAKK